MRVLPTAPSVRLQVVCSVKEDGERDLSLPGCRMELVESEVAKKVHLS